MGAFGLLDDSHHTRIAPDRLVDANPRVDIWALLRDGVLVEGAEVEARWGTGGSRLATREGGILIDGTRVLLSWDEPMEGVGRPRFECPVCHRAAVIFTFASWPAGAAAGSITAPGIFTDRSLAFIASCTCAV